MPSPTRPNSFLRKALVFQTFFSCGVTLIFPHGTSVGDTKLTSDVSPPINLDPPFPYYGVSHQTLQVYEDGFITLDDNQVRTPYLFDQLEVGFPAIVPWLARMDAELSQGEVTYRLTRNTTLLNEISAYSAQFVEFTNFVPAYALIATWYNTGTVFYDNSTNNKVNSFQIVMTSDGSKSLVLLDYIKVEWVYFDDPSFYSDYDGIENFPMYAIKTEVSFHKGDAATHVRLAVSYTAELFDIVRDSNVNQPSAYAFKVDSTPTNLTAIEKTSVMSSTSEDSTPSVMRGKSTVTTAPNNLNTLATTSAASTETIISATPSAVTINNTFNYNSSNHGELYKIHQSNTKLIIGLSCAGTFSFLFLIVIVILCCKLKFYKKSRNGRVSPNTFSTNERLTPSMPTHSHIILRSTE